MKEQVLGWLKLSSEFPPDYIAKKICQLFETDDICIGWEGERPILGIDGLELDNKVADLVYALNKGGVATASSCSGHGKQLGHVLLKDGRLLIIYYPDYTKGDQAWKGDVVKMLERS